MNFLVDTNVIAELVRPRPNPGVLAWADRITRLSLSVVTVEEIHYGLAWKPNLRITTWFEGFLASQCEVLPVTAEVARRAGELRGRLRTRGRTRSQADMLIAATALVAGLTVVSRNIDDFEGCGVPVLDPFVDR